MTTYRSNFSGRAPLPTPSVGRATFTLERRRRALFFRPHEVPVFEGESAWFEAKCHDGQWRIVRRVDELGAPMGAINSPTFMPSTE